MGAPWFKFYPTDYLADSKVRMLTREQRSILVELWCYCAKDGSVQANAKAIARLLAEQEEVIVEALGVLSPFFNVEGGYLFSRRMQTESEAYERKCEKLRANASLGGKHRQSNAKANAKANGQAESAEPEPEPEVLTTPTPSGKKTKAKRGSAAAQVMNNPEAMATFRAAWQLHPRRRDTAGNLRPAGNQAKGAAALQARVAEGVKWEEVLGIEREYLSHPDVKNGYAQNFEVFWGENGHWFGMLQIVRQVVA